MRCYIAAFSMATIAILGTMDTKGEEHGFVADRIKQRGHQVLVIDVGALGAPRLNPDITRREVAAAADVDFDALAAKRDRGETVAAMSKGAPVVLSRLVAEKKSTASFRWAAAAARRLARRRCARCRLV